MIDEIEKTIQGLLNLNIIETFSEENGSRHAELNEGDQKVGDSIPSGETTNSTNSFEEVGTK